MPFGYVALLVFVCALLIPSTAGHRPDVSNALLQYFGGWTSSFLILLKRVDLTLYMETITEADLDLHSASEDDEEEIFIRGPAHESENEADEEREDQEDDQDNQDDDEPVVISKASFMYREPEPASSSQAPPASPDNTPAGPPVVDDDSVTGEAHYFLPRLFDILILL